MSSSDSDCDYFSNAAKKLHQLKKQYRDNDIDLSDLISGSNDLKSTSAAIVKASQNITQPTINTKKLTSQKRGRKTGGKRNDTNNRETKILIDEINQLLTSLPQDNEIVNNNCSCGNSLPARGRGRRKYPRRCKQSTCQCRTSMQSPDLELPRSTRNTSRISRTPNVYEMLETGSRRSATSRGRRNARSRGRRTTNLMPDQSIPTYNIGNFDYYFDHSESVSLFSKPHHGVSDKLGNITNKNIVGSQTDSNLIEKLSVTEMGSGVYLISDKSKVKINEEQEIFNVKVHWQSDKIYIFKLGLKDKLSVIFDFFQYKEKAALEKMLFMYNDIMLQPDHTVESINYNIAKIIEGGLLSSYHPEIYCINEESSGKGISIKFQFQGVKKSFETTVQKDDTLCKAMTKCAMFIDQPILKLQFELDGDIITGDMKPSDLDIEGGECIDVRIKE